MVEEKILKARISRVIAATRFPFVGQDDWDETRSTVVNDHKNKVWAFETPDGPLYPSVAVFNADGTIRECGEVEVTGNFTEATVQKWKTLSELTGMGEKYKKFFLYVPEGHEVQAEKLLNENHIEYAGLRTWRIDNWNLVLTPYKTPDMAKDHR
ncbi:MAG: hypothetical protein NWE89_17630 [Candidatus Bathyarchaeota archaeon]|nr:hypothetical protein [Candidatus Bathyarchaeota archaeon]